MPPDSPLASDHTVDEQALSDQNVAILYEIVELAEAQSNVETQPFRALFTAYESILPQHGIATAHDRVYLRFLFRLGQKRGQEETLFDTFERLLEELGIQLEFQEGGSVPQAQDEFTESVRNPTVAEITREKRSRRASLSAIDDEGETAHFAKDKHPTRAVSHEAPTHLKDRIMRKGLKKSTVHATQKAIVDPRRLEREISPNNNLRRRYSISSTANNKSNDKNVNSGPERPNMQPLTHSNSPDQSPSQPPSPSAHHDLLPKLVPSSARLYQPSRIQLFRDAEVFQYHRIRAVARDIVDKWCDAAFKARHHYEHQHRLATARDTEVLVRQAFFHWRTRLHARKQAAATNKFFARVEKRASRARDLYLLTKALTHWSQTALDERRQRQVARQRILAVKYFHAWHEIALENQNKQQYKLRKKHFGIWKQECVESLTRSYKAESILEQDLVKRIYWQWFWAFCERRAPEWHVRRLKQRCLINWLERFRANRIQVSEVAQTRKLASLKAIVVKWSAQARLCLQHEKESTDCRNRTAISLVVGKWRRELQYLPSTKKLLNMADWRIAGTTFAVFVNRFRYEQEAVKLDRIRLLRNLWTIWNDRLRQWTLSQRVNSNLSLATMYRWVIATRLSLLQRFFNVRQKARSFRLWAEKMKVKTNLFARLADQWEVNRRPALLHGALIAWASQAREQHRALQIAHEFHAPKLAVDTLMLWKDNLRIKQTAKESAEDARFFFLARRVLRTWRKRVEESKRQKRREAYAIVRRKLKIRIASRALTLWRSKSAGIAEQLIISEHTQQERSSRVATASLDKWKALLDTLLDDAHEAFGHSQRKLLRRSFDSWVEQSEHWWNQEETAAANLSLRMEKTSVVLLRRWQLRLIDLRSQQGKGEVLRANYEKRHQRNLLYAWRDRTSAHQKRLSETPVPTAQSRALKRIKRAETFGETRRAEEWTELDTRDWVPAIEAQGSSTPLPSYLSTPSRRASRAKAIVQSTTPIGTPFQSRLRAQLNLTPRSARLGAFSKSRSGLNPVRSVLEESPPVHGNAEDEGNDD